MRRSTKLWVRVFAAALLLAGCARQTTTLGGGNPDGYSLGRTLVAVDFAAEELRRATELKLAEQLAELDIPATVSFGLVQPNVGPAVADEARRLGGFDSVLLLWGYERRVTTTEVRSCESPTQYDRKTEKPGKGGDLGLAIYLGVLSGFVTPYCPVRRTEERIRVEYRATLYDVATLRPVWEGVSSRGGDRGPECFAAMAADEIVNWLRRDALLPGRPPLLPISGTIVASCILP